MRHPNWSSYASESAADFAAEDRFGAYAVEPPTPEEDAALSLELARENAEGAEDDVPRDHYGDAHYEDDRHDHPRPFRHAHQHQHPERTHVVSSDAHEHAHGRLAVDHHPLCDWCSEPLSDDEFFAYCSIECQQEATRETYASVRPRPEEVGQ